MCLYVFNKSLCLFSRRVNKETLKKVNQVKETIQQVKDVTY